MSESAAQIFDVIVIGAGAAGMMCAMTAGARGKSVVLIDHADEAGKKILISGGGRCNFTNLNCRPENFISGNPHFAKSALARYTPSDFIALINKHQISWHEKTLGQLFCDGSARAVVAMLLAECEAANVTLRLSQSVREITKPDHFRVVTNRGTYAAPALVLATGGLSIPKMGATDFAHHTARKFGLSLTKVRPALVPLKVADDDLHMMQPLSGVSMPCIASIGKRSFREAMLLTHRGLSGPAILQISSYWREGDQLSLNILPDMDATAHLLHQKKDSPRVKAKNVLGRIMPGRLADALSEAHQLDRSIHEITDRALRELGSKLNAWRLTPRGSEGYAKAEVTLGGIDTDQLSSKTMQAKAVPGLFVIGEAVDVTGWLGGYNFQWAWASGFAAGEAV